MLAFQLLYYTRLAKMEAETEAEANGPRRASERADMVAAGPRSLRTRPDQAESALRLAL